MDDLTQRYYEAEMRYLREAGKEFAQAYPDRAAMLNLDKPGARDPYVERLFEGFAFNGATARKAGRRPARTDRGAGQPAVAALPAHHSVAFRGRTDHGSPANEAK